MRVYRDFQVSAASVAQLYFSWLLHHTGLYVVCRRFGGKCCSHFKGDLIRYISKAAKTDMRSRIDRQPPLRNEVRLGN
jgi:hypothetical protein